MNNVALFNKVSLDASRITTHSYSTSFSLGIRLLNSKIRNPIYAIYGFVRFADEIVDTFHEHDKKVLLEEFKQETYKAIERGISLNPILHSFQAVVNEYKIDKELIDSFLKSIEIDLYKNVYDGNQYQEYILGSAEVVGLMCLKVFCNGDQEQYSHLKYYAMKLGAAFQKINFLRDMKADYMDLGRTYFPNVDLTNFDQKTKNEIEEDIQKDFDEARIGIKQLPKSARFGVYLAYKYYLKLFEKIKGVPPQKVMSERIRIPDNKKIDILFRSYLRNSFNIL